MTDKLTAFLDLYLVQKAPFQIPETGRQWIVRYAPWMEIVLIIFSLPLVLLALGITTVALPFMAFGAGTGLFATVIMLLGTGLMIASVPGLFARSRRGWTLAYYAELLDLLSGVVSLNILSAIVGALFGLYFLFQIRAYYK